MMMYEYCSRVFCPALPPDTKAARDTVRCCPLTDGCYNDEYNIPDISTDRAKVEEMVRLFNSAELSPCHMRDVIYDMIG